MIGIENVGIYVPNYYISNYDKKDKFEIDDNFIKDKIGVEQVTRKSINEDTSDMCVEAFRHLTTKVDINIEDVECLIVCTQNPDNNGIPHTSSIVHSKLKGKESCACFDISLGCSGYVYSLSIIKSFMEANGMNKGLLFTADPYSKIIDEDDKNTSLLFGDAATVTLLTNSKNSWFPRKFLFATNGKGSGALHNNNGVLEMDGRAVFNFSATVVPLQVNNLLKEIDMKLDDIDLILFHQGSKYIIDTLIRRLKLDKEKVPIELNKHGNTVSSSIPLILEQSITKPINRILMSGFGLGLSWGSCVIEKRKKE
ncbi:ketoacyl-ACP synthase III [Heliorestis acidaminivorans]|uniref:Ketoacyl-ACP synthase III n=1 Tax=Heliorestis acidaminivorans TaxID=553427 RepID=A0A6I0F8E0_9FIRM|nr:ketoacyl-ACP synthase III [Heliorestis acidaminivorans]KAB2953768.1 ketoacyl-ACP synthase III [Heliorestis acidaminivorans]